LPFISSMHRCSDKIRKHVDRIMHLMPLAIIMRSPVTCRNGRSMLLHMVFSS
jgi:hypothetical protein